MTDHAATTQFVRARVKSFGKVQGVFYRDTLRRAAAEQGVTGFAINLEDGSVEAVFEGPREPVAAMIEVAKQGPPAAHVQRIEVVWEEPENLRGFVTGGPGHPHNH